jgi:predicted ATPase
MTAVETTKETWFQAEVHRVAGEIALASPDQDALKAESHLKQALAVASQQKARDEACDLLAPVYNWFTEGFDTLDLKEAKALLGELGALQ